MRFGPDGPNEGETVNYQWKEDNTPLLRGYVIEVTHRNAVFTVSLIASTKGTAITRTRVGLVNRLRDVTLLMAEARVVETLTVEEFTNKRAAGLL